jgi:hypothetical protein
MTKKITKFGSISRRRLLTTVAWAQRLPHRGFASIAGTGGQHQDRVSAFD